jgi:hypothetical protein
VTEQAATKEPGLLTTEEGAGDAGTGPLLLIRGSATDAEVAALVAVLQAHASAAAASAAEPEAVPVSSWAAPERKLRVTHPHGPGGWRASGLPR